jgi:hypothetical protein
VHENPVGLYVQEVGATDRCLWRNADRSMNPASTMKLVTTLTQHSRFARAALRMAHRGVRGWHAYRRHADGNRIKGYGDQLTLENFWFSCASFAAAV